MIQSYFSSAGITTSPNGHVATQEELDSVINLLSGVGTGSQTHMSPIPEQQGNLSLQVPSLYSSLSPAASDSCMDSLKTQRIQSQRRSEGSLDLSGFGNQGRNTWPHQHRSSLPGQFICQPLHLLYSTAGIMVSCWTSVCLSVRSCILFLDDNSSKYQLIFTKLGTCIDIVRFGL